MIQLTILFYGESRAESTVNCEITDRGLHTLNSRPVPPTHRIMLTLHFIMLILLNSSQQTIAKYHKSIPKLLHNNVVNNVISPNDLSVKLSHGNEHTIKLYYNDVYTVRLPENHRFPMEKYRLVREGLQTDLESLVHIREVEFCISPLAKREELSTTHCPTYMDKYLSGNLSSQEIRRTGFPWSDDQVKRTLSSVGGTVAATRAVLSSSTDASCHIAGGTHHAFYNYGEGFCIFSDIAVAANGALKEFPRKVKKILIVDLDVHQGNGNAVLFENNPAVITFSMHCSANYFSSKQKSDFDVEIDPSTDDETYLGILSKWMAYLMKEVQPDLVYYQAGVDIINGDRLGKLRISPIGVDRRNEIVYSAVKSAGKKIVVTMGGGYPNDLNPKSESFLAIVTAHKNVYKQCVHYFRKVQSK